MLGILNVSYRYLSQPQVGHKCQSKVMGHCDTPFQSCRGFDKYIFDVVGLLDAQKKLAIDPTILESKVDQLRIFDRNQVKFGVFSEKIFFYNFISHLFSLQSICPTMFKVISWKSGTN